MNFDLDTLIFKHDLHRVEMNQHAKYVGHRSFTSKVILQKHTHQTRCSTWTS